MAIKVQLNIYYLGKNMSAKQFKNLFIMFVILILTACSGNGSSSNANNNEESAVNLSLTAPDQYPAGIATTAYLTVVNASTSVANNLTYRVASNNTGADIQVDSASSVKCESIPALGSCILTVSISAGSNPGSFAIAVGSSNQSNSLGAKLKSIIGLDSQTNIIKANIGLTTMSANSESGANGISFLYSPTITVETSGATSLSVVAVVGQNAGNNFNTINLTTQSGTPLNFEVVSGNSGTGMTNLVAGSVVTFVLKIPAGATSPYQFYAQTTKNSSLVNQGTVPQSVVLSSSVKGVLIVQPTGFNLSTVDNYTSQIVTYTNTGNGLINGLAIEKPQSPIKIVANDCPTSLEAGRSCLVVLNLTAAESSGSGSLVATYDDGNAVISQYNYVGTTPNPTPSPNPTLPPPSPQAGVSLSAVNNFSFTANTSAGSSATQVTLQNNGNTSEHDFVFSFNPNQYFALSQSGSDTCQINGSTVTSMLAAGDSCTFTLTYDNTSVAVGLTTMTVNYQYNGASAAATTKTLAYQTTLAGTSLSIIPDFKYFGGIVADNTDSKIQSFVLTNAGSLAATAINFQSITGDSGYFTVDSSGIGGCASATPLASGQSCTFSVKFGPTTTVKDSIVGVLPINYSYAGGSSSTSVNLAGYSQAVNSAEIELDSIVATATAGDGQSQNNAYQFESTTATTATITLHYKNIGLGDATSFTVTNPPAGYTVDNSSTCGAGNMVTLQANSANSCTVVLHPTASTVGGLNITLSSSSLTGNWSSGSSSISNQTILWNTGSGTQNTIYANIYAAPQVTAVMSSQLSGTPSITQVKINQTFYIVLSLSGGYNVNTSYTITAPVGFSPVSSSCSITSSNPQCSVAITAPAVTASTQNITITASGGVTPIPASFTFDVVAPTMHAYIANGTPGVFQCTVSDTDGSLACLTPSTRPNGSLDALSTIVDPMGNYLYVLTNDSTSPGSYITCALDSHGTYDNTKCETKTFPPYGNLAFAATGNNWFAYLAGMPASNGGNPPNYCTVFQESSLFCNVAVTTPTSAAKGVTSIVVDGSSLVYLSGTNNTDSPYNAKISVCDVTNNAGYTNCRAAYFEMSITNPTSLSAVQIGADYYVYVLDYLSQVAYCKIETVGSNKGKFISCNYIDSLFLDVTNGVQSITAVNLNGSPYLYAPSPNEHIINICPLNPDGGIDDYVCNPYVPDSSIIPSYIPRGISFGSFY